MNEHGWGRVKLDKKGKKNVSWHWKTKLALLEFLDKVIFSVGREKSRPSSLNRPEIVGTDKRACLSKVPLTVSSFVVRLFQATYTPRKNAHA